ncbi:MAG: S-layer homology domain-containing protein [Clostridiales bacterium]|nr:S-layer homology domain-containing protein [Clostridiales bacterium]
MKKIFVFVLTLTLLMCFSVPVLANHETVYPCQTVTIGNRGYIDKNGSLWLWGENDMGQAGVDPDVTEWVDSPTKVMDDVVSFDRGSRATIVLRRDGSVWTFGLDYRHGYRIIRNNIQWLYGEDPVKALDDCVAVSNGGGYGNQFGALKSDGTLWVFGHNLWNSLGLDDDTVTDGSVVDKLYVTEPQKICGDVASFVMGHYNGFVIKKDGSVWYWGNDEWSPYHTSGGDHGTHRHILDGFRQITVDNGWAAGVMNDGTAWLWGGNFTMFGDLKLDQRIKIATDAKMVVGTYTGDEVIELEHYEVKNKPHYCYVLKNDGSLWGKDGTEKIMDDVASVYCQNGYYNETLILKNDGTLIERKGAQDSESPLRYTEEDRIITDNAAIPGTFSVTKDLPSGDIEQHDDKVSDFKDVHDYDWFVDSVLWAIDRGITSGTSKTEFSPYQICSTAQIITFIWRWKGCPLNSGISYFSDLDGSEYYYDAAQWAYEAGLVGGDSFDGSAECTRAAAVEYMWKASGKPSYSPFSLFIDVPEEASYAQAVSWAFDLNITRGTRYNTFSPDKTCNRAEILTFLYRAENGAN